MGKKVRSAMGSMVDFDALKIKQQLASTPSSTEVNARMESVDVRNNRRAARRAAQDIKRAANLSEESAVDVSIEDIIDSELLTEEDVPQDTLDPQPTTRKQQTRK
jgi:5'-3' exonuclease